MKDNLTDAKYAATVKKMLITEKKSVPACSQDK